MLRSQTPQKLGASLCCWQVKVWMRFEYGPLYIAGEIQGVNIGYFKILQRTLGTSSCPYQDLKSQRGDPAHFFFSFMGVKKTIQGYQSISIAYPVLVLPLQIFRSVGSLGDLHKHHQR